MELGISMVIVCSMSVINNTSKPKSVLKKKNNTVCYHIVRGSVVMGKSLTAHISGDENPTALLTKVILVERGGM